MSGPLSAATLVPGRAEGPAFVLAEPLSFWGGFDAGTGRIIDRWHPQEGATLAGHVLVMTAGPAAIARAGRKRPAH